MSEEEDDIIVGQIEKAIENSDYSTLRRLLDESKEELGDIFTQWLDHSYFLHKCMPFNTGAAKILVKEYGADVNSLDEKGSTALCYCHSPDVVKVMIADLGADLFVPLKIFNEISTWYPLHVFLASVYKHDIALQALELVDRLTFPSPEYSFFKYISLNSEFAWPLAKRLLDMGYVDEVSEDGDFFLYYVCAEKTTRNTVKIADYLCKKYRKGISGGPDTIVTDADGQPTPYTLLDEVIAKSKAALMPALMSVTERKIQPSNLAEAVFYCRADLIGTDGYKSDDYRELIRKAFRSENTECLAKLLDVSGLGIEVASVPSVQIEKENKWAKKDVSAAAALSPRIGVTKLITDRLDCDLSGVTFGFLLSIDRFIEIENVELILAKDLTLRRSGDEDRQLPPVDDYSLIDILKKNRLDIFGLLIRYGLLLPFEVVDVDAEGIQQKDRHGSIREFIQTENREGVIISFEKDSTIFNHVVLAEALAVSNNYADATERFDYLQTSQFVSRQRRRALPPDTMRLVANYLFQKEKK